MLQFEDLVVNNFLYWKDECIWGKNQKSIWIMHCWSMYNIYIYIYIFFLSLSVLMWEKGQSQVIFVRKVFKLKFTTALHSIWVKKNLRGATEKKTNKKPNVLLKMLGLLVIKLVNLLVFERISWLIISNWSFQKKCGICINQMSYPLWLGWGKRQSCRKSRYGHKRPTKVCGGHPPKDLHLYLIIQWHLQRMFVWMLGKG